MKANIFFSETNCTPLSHWIQRRSQMQFCELCRLVFEFVFFFIFVTLLIPAYTGAERVLTYLTTEPKY